MQVQQACHSAPRQPPSYDDARNEAEGTLRALPFDLDRLKVITGRRDPLPAYIGCQRLCKAATLAVLEHVV